MRNFLFASFIVASGLSVGAGPAVAAGVTAYSCDPDMPIITLNVKFSRIKTDRRYSTAEIQTLAKRLGNTQHGGTLTGLYRGIIQTSTRIKQAHRTWADGRECTYPIAIELSQTVDRTVYIAREHPVGSCRYTATKKHELQHVKFDEQVVNNFRSRLRASVASALRRRLTLPLSSIKTAIKNATQSLLNQMNTARQARHATIDTPQNYRRESLKCRSYR